MKTLLLLFMATCVALAQSNGADVPSISSLKKGDKIYVEMRLYGYTITGADYLFTAEKVIVKPLNKNPKELILTADEKSKVDEYFLMVQRGKKGDLTRRVFNIRSSFIEMSSK